MRQKQRAAQQASGAPQASPSIQTLKKGDLFVALKGPNTEGHDYVETALEHGAVAAIVDHIPEGIDKNKCLLVKDTLKALEDLARAARVRTDAIYIAVTGSVGKTSTKDMLECAFSKQFKTHASQKSYNNHWGVPLTLALMPQETEIGIFEIGMNHTGEISPLSKMVKPHIAMITTVEAVHIENFEDGEEGVAKAKAEIFDGLPEGGRALIKRDNKWFDLLSDHAKEKNLLIRTFGKDAAVPLHAAIENVVVGAETTSFETYISGGVNGKILMNVSGEHHAYNAAAVLLCAAEINLAVENGDIRSAHHIDMDMFELALSKWSQRDGRGKKQKVFIEGNAPPIILIDEHYNASPVAMRAAFRALKNTPLEGRGRRIAVLGDMAELGDETIQYHKDLATDLMEAEIDCLFAAGPSMKHLYDQLPPDKQTACTELPSDLVQPLKEQLRAGDVVLIKGSRGGGEKPKMQVLVDTVKSLAHK